MTELIIYSGNTFHQKVEPNAAISTSIINTLDKWATEKPEKSACQLNSNVQVIPPFSYFEEATACSKTSDITAKLFLPQGLSGEERIHAIESALHLFIEFFYKKRGCRAKYFILDLQGITFSDDLESAEQIIPSEELLSAWKTLTSIGVKEKGVIQEYGISEMSTERLEAFLGQLTELPKPSVDHINAADCCALPPGLISLSKQQNIKLIAHHDSEEILSKSELQEICSSRLDKSCTYDLQWVLRLTFIVRDRQVLTGNEYLVGVKKIAV